MFTIPIVWLEILTLPQLAQGSRRSSRQLGELILQAALMAVGGAILWPRQSAGPMLNTQTRLPPQKGK
jgi:hypothetical protein